MEDGEAVVDSPGSARICPALDFMDKVFKRLDCRYPNPEFRQVQPIDIGGTAAIIRPPASTFPAQP